MQAPAIPALGRGIWREPKNTDLHAYKQEAMFGNLRPHKTNGVMTLCQVVGTGDWVFVHADNIEPIRVITARNKPPAPSKPVRPASEARIVANILDGLL